jgi:hypothetical protein
MTSPQPELDLESLTSRKLGSLEFSFTERDLILYALGLGCQVGCSTLGQGPPPPPPRLATAA